MVKTLFLALKAAFTRYGIFFRHLPGNSTYMYTLQDFRIMPFEKKCDLITFKGSYLAQRMLADCKVFLYFAGDFFIEVFYSPKHQKVLMINAFDKPFGLEPYLDTISLTDLGV
jgi:hypothetical protein